MLSKFLGQTEVNFKEGQDIYKAKGQLVYTTSQEILSDDKLCCQDCLCRPTGCSLKSSELSFREDTK